MTEQEQQEMRDLRKELDEAERKALVWKSIAIAIGMVSFLVIAKIKYGWSFWSE
ncbi:MAG TPA: hypothetical protein VI454_14565 [Verrucomicrobiae bacterium]